MVVTGGEGEKGETIDLIQTQAFHVKGKSTDHYTKDTITYKSRLTPKKWHKKTDAIFSIHGKNGIIP